MGKANPFSKKTVSQQRLQRAELTTQGPSIKIDDDFQGWLLDQAAALRDRRYPSLDLEHLAEELEDMAALRREALQSNLIVVLVHLLKLAYETRPAEIERQERQWKLHLVEHRDCVNDLLRDSGTLRAEFETLKIEAYGRARKRAGLAIEPNEAPIGPEQCPWSAEQILAGISVLPLHFNFAYRTNGLPRQGFGPVLVHGTASRAGMGRFSVSPPCNPQKCRLSNRSADSFSHPPYLLTKICCAPRAAYPAGTGSVTILCSMAPNSRRVRWLSASSNQW
jgi:hypothetical protein